MYRQFITCLILLFSSFVTVLSISNDEDYFERPIAPGRIIQSFVNIGQEVRRGDRLFIIECMKMEYQIRATQDGFVTRIFSKVGQNLDIDGPMLEMRKSPLLSNSSRGSNLYANQRLRSVLHTPMKKNDSQVLSLKLGNLSLYPNLSFQIFVQPLSPVFFHRDIQKPPAIKYRDYEKVPALTQNFSIMTEIKNILPKSFVQVDADMQVVCASNKIVRAHGLKDRQFFMRSHQEMTLMKELVSLLFKTLRQSEFLLAIGLIILMSYRHFFLPRGTLLHSKLRLFFLKSAAIKIK